MSSHRGKDMVGARLECVTVLRRDESHQKGGGIWWVCLCKCGNEFSASGKSLRSGSTKSCGCLRKQRKPRIDITGQKFNRLTAVEYVGENRWKCVCECGNETKVQLGKLKSGHTKSCGCFSRENVSRRRRAKLLGRKFGRLKVVSENGVRKTSFMWNCICDCGAKVVVPSMSLLGGGTQSCGCLQKERVREARTIDMTGMRCGRFTVLCRAQNKGEQAAWTCLCDCGKEVDVVGSSLRSGASRSCGCLSRDRSRERADDLIGRIFGRLTVIRRADRKTGTLGVYWVCLCECGETLVVPGNNLKSGNTKSCGCLHRELASIRAIQTNTGRFGPDSPHWDATKTKAERERRRAYPEYVQWQADVLKRDDYTCQICDVRGGSLSTHHLDGYHWAKKKRTLLSNGVTMCTKCHKALHKIYTNYHNKRSQYVLFKAMHKQKTREAVNA